MVQFNKGLYSNDKKKLNKPVVREENPEMSRQDLMREVGKMWKEKKEGEKE